MSRTSSLEYKKYYGQQNTKTASYMNHEELAKQTATRIRWVSPGDSGKRRAAMEEMCSRAELAQD